MNEQSTVSYRQALENARNAARDGNLTEAEYWAEAACAAAPGKEEPWLLIGELASGDKRVEYCLKALEVNPKSKAARQGLHTAIRHQRGHQTFTTQELTPTIRLSAPFAATIQRRTSFRTAFVLAALIAVLAFGIVTGAPSIHALADTAAGFFPTETLPVYLASRNNVLTPTPTQTYTPTPTLTPTATATSTPRPTRTPLPPTATARSVHSQRPGYVGSNEVWVEIDLGEQRLTAYRGDDVLRTFSISSGTWLTPTVTGTFQIYNMLNYQNMAGTGYYLPDVPYVMYFYDDYAIHGAYWHDNFGIPMSHGCVNMEPIDAGWLYQNAEIGTWVIIHY